MAIEIKVPAAGESITSANIAKWYKSNGDSVKKGEPLVSLETDKVSNELEAEADGILTITVGEGEEVAIGTVIGKLETGTAQPAATPAPIPAAQAPAPTAAPTASGAPVEIKVPAAGESITSANIAAWRKKDGDHVEKGEILVSLETDKVSNDLEAPVSGTLHILTPEGEEVAIGKVIANITPGGSAPVAAAPQAPAVVASPTPRPAPDLAVVSAPIAVEKPTAPVTEGRTTRKKMSMLRRKIATHLVNAQQTAAIR